MGPLNRPFGALLDGGTRRQLRQLDVRTLPDAERLVWRDTMLLGVGGFALSSRYEKGGAGRAVTQHIGEYLIRTKTGGWHSTAKAFIPPESSCDRWTRVQWRGVEMDLSRHAHFEQTSAELELLGIPADRRQNPLVSFNFHEKTLLVPALLLVEVAVWPSAWVGECLLHPPSRPLVCSLGDDGRELTLRINARADRGARRVRGSVPFENAVALAYWLGDSRAEQLHECVAEPVYRREAISVPRVPGAFKFALDGYMCGDLVVVQALGYKDLDPCWPMDWHTLTIRDEQGTIHGRFVPIAPDKLECLY